MTKNQAIRIWNTMMVATARELITFYGSTAHDIPLFKGEGQERGIQPVVKLLREMADALDSREDG